MPNETRQQVVVLGGEFGGVFSTKHLRRIAGDKVEIVLISRHNFFVFQPLLAEIAGGSFNPGHGVTPLRRFLAGVAVMVAEFRLEVDLSRTPGLAARTLVMKDVMDVFGFRHQMLGCLERADGTSDAGHKRSLLSFVVIGGGFTGIETVGEVQELIQRSLKHYPKIRPDEIRTILMQHGSRILPQLSAHLAGYAAAQLQRRGIEIRLGTGVTAVSPSTATAVCAADEAGPMTVKAARMSLATA